MAENESFLFGIIRNIQSNRNRKRLIRNLEIENENNKGITKYKPSQIEAFFSPSDPLGNVMISGGIPILRDRAVLGSLQSAVANGIGIVIIHAGNSMLESMVQQHYPHSVVFNRSTSIYDPLIGLSNAEINRMIQAAALKQAEIPSAGQYYIEGMTEFIRSKNIPPYCEMYITCPHLELFDKVDDAEAKGYINSSLAQKIKTYLMQGQMHRSDVERFFNILRHQTQGLLANKLNLSRAKSLQMAIRNREISIIDIGSNANDLLLNLIFEDIASAVNNGRNVFIVMDGIKISASDKVEQYIRNSGSGVYTVISADDIYSSLNADDSLFNACIGKTLKSIVYQHSSSVSCTKWADTFGFYDKKEVSKTYSSGQSYQSAFSIIPGQAEGESIIVNIKRTHRVLPEEINHLNKDEVYIYDAVNGELAYTTVI